MHSAAPLPSSSPRSARLARRSRGPGLLTAVVLTVSAAVSGCATSTDHSVPAQSPTPSASASTGGSQDVRFTVGYAGDVLMHMPVMESTPGASGDITANIAAETPWVEGLDLALCGMEVPVAPDGVYSGYPSFGTSAEVVAALARSGWDGCATASNHAADRGEAGVVATLDALDAHGLGHAGTYRSRQDASVPFALYELERGGRTVTVAQISTTMDLNGLEDPTGYSVSLNDVGTITKAATSARAAGADLVVVHSQLGEEYETTPNDKQVSYAQSLADSGQVDILFGAHPHVPQPAEKLSGGVGGKGMWVSYSAGNYISNQDEECCAPLSDVGQLVWADVTSHADGSVSVDKLNWHPFTMDLAGGHKIRDLAALHNGERPADLGLSTEQIDRRWSLLTSQVKDASTMSTTPPTPTGPAPTIPSREEVITRAGAHPAPQGTASASSSPR
ncbi:capsule biosynthesis protein [Actinomyces oris]|uniref:CapA family protein n=1 Tax=Actinomyces TaxID=1654 RepID=UPI00094D26FD|nr:MULTISPECIES: CapA family protein [Actinomyces]OLO63711.1 capsule biosynthesis protein [Actinomyces oris]OLO69560.1 capsule biosynthesis protein [Actinomyces oris]